MLLGGCCEPCCVVGYESKQLHAGLQGWREYTQSSVQQLSALDWAGRFWVRTESSRFTGQWDRYSAVCREARQNYDTSEEFWDLKYLRKCLLQWQQQRSAASTCTLWEKIGSGREAQSSSNQAQARSSPSPAKKTSVTTRQRSSAQGSAADAFKSMSDSIINEFL